MSQDVESIYEEYISKLKQAVPNVDPNLTHRVMYLERKLSVEDMKEPDISAVIEYKKGSDIDKKMSNLRTRCEVEAEHADEENAVHIVGRMKMGRLKEIASDKDIVKITGKADPGYGE